MWVGVLFAMNSQILSARDVFAHVAHPTWRLWESHGSIPKSGVQIVGGTIDPAEMIDKQHYRTSSTISCEVDKWFAFDQEGLY